MAGVKFSAKVEGMDDLVKKLRVMPDRIQGRALMAAVEEGGEVAQEYAMALAPRGENNPHAFEFIAANVAASSPTFVQADVGPTGRGFYLTFHETGTRYMAPQPFMRQALESGESEILAAVAARLRRELRLGVK